MTDANRQGELIRRQLKVLLLYLAAKSESPDADLQRIIRDVLQELHQEVKECVMVKPRLKLVPGTAEKMS